MNNLNALAESIATEYNRQTDIVFLEKLKFDIKNLRSLFISRDSERNIIDPRLIQSFCMDLEVVDMSVCCDVNVGCKILRTVNKVPVPIKLKATSPFTFIGGLDGTGFSMSKIEDWDLERYRRYTNKKTYYDYLDERIYINKNAGVLSYLLVKGIFENPDDLKKCCSSTENVANFDLETYPLPLDLGARIKETIQARLRQYNGEDKEVKIDEETVKK